MCATIQNIPLKTITGIHSSLNDYAGKVLLVVNVASKCGLTPQYDGLEKLYKEYREQGLVVLAFPANDFGAQEPGTNEEIAQFCETSYSVDFPMFAKIAVTGNETHALYRELTGSGVPVTGDADGFREKLKGYGMTPNPAPGILWNFEKFLIARDGSIAARFAPTLTPDDPQLIAAIRSELAKIPAANRRA